MLKASVYLAVRPDPAEVLRSAVTWTYRVMSISLSMALPAVGGYWLDFKLETGFVFIVLGALGGFILGLIQLLAIGKKARQEKHRNDSNQQTTSG
ncbi:MAG: AtpZ/AtpI family protein [Pirellulales bacterium]|nr:AtpZ/AtpI family protein [Pirellulales bacterium]